MMEPLSTIFFFVVMLPDGRPCPRSSIAERMHTQTIVEPDADQTTPQMRNEGEKLP